MTAKSYRPYLHSLCPKHAPFSCQAWNLANAAITSAALSDAIVPSGRCLPSSNPTHVGVEPTLPGDSISQFRKRNFAARDWRALPALKACKSAKSREKTALKLAQAIELAGVSADLETGVDSNRDALGDAFG
jgi:hypothetical protein